MELNNEILSGLSLINSPHLDQKDLVSIFDQCGKTLTSGLCTNTNHTTQPLIDEKSILKNVLIFSLNALLLEAAKYNVNESVVISLLQENSIDSTTDNFKLFSNFVHDTLKLVRHNMHNLQLNPVPNFNDLEWSQIFDLKSSSVDNIKEKSYLVDFQTDIASGQKQVFSMTFSHKELQDLHATLRDCVKNVECFLNNK